MKVVFCTREYDDLSGGQNTWLCHFLPDLRQRGVEVKVLCFTLSEKIYATVLSLRKSGISCTTCSEKEHVTTEDRIHWLLEQLLDDPPDVFVINMVIPAPYYAARWLRHAGIPTVGVCHIGVGHSLYRGLLNSFVLGDKDYRVPTLVCVSQYLEQDVIKRNPLGTTVKYIPCGVRIPNGVAERPRDRLRLAYVGRLAEEAKRIVEVTKALCRAVREVPGTEAFIYGDGEERKAVERILSENNRLPFHLSKPNRSAEGFQFEVATAAGSPATHSATSWAFGRTADKRSTRAPFVCASEQRWAINISFLTNRSDGPIRCPSSTMINFTFSNRSGAALKRARAFSGVAMLISDSRASSVSTELTREPPYRCDTP
jgi:glycosyltransferase involved in cell wall biosynthesis